MSTSLSTSSRKILNPEKVHPSALAMMQKNYSSDVDAVINAVATHQVVIVGMAQNPVVKKAKRILTDAGIAFHYIEHGSYFSKWRLRLAIKLWSGWPTFPQVFIKGQLIGGCDDLVKFLAANGNKI